MFQCEAMCLGSESPCQCRATNSDRIVLSSERLRASSFKLQAQALKVHWQAILASAESEHQDHEHHVPSVTALKRKFLADSFSLEADFVKLVP